MKKPIRQFVNAFFPLGMLLLLTACSDDDFPRPGYGKAELHTTLTNNAGTFPIKVGAFTVADFVVGIKEVDMLHLPQSALDVGVTLENGTLQSNAESPLGRSSGRNPQPYILYAGNEPQKLKIGEGETPNGLYNELTFKLHKNATVSGKEAANNTSFFISGDLDGTPTKIWLEEESLIRVISKASEGYLVEGGRNSFLLSFNADRLFANVNFSSAVDLDNNGTIEIGPNNADSNGNIHDRIKNNIAASIEFIKE